MPNKGYKPTLEHRRKLSEALKGRMPKFIPHHKKGELLNKEIKKKISDTLKRKGIKPPSRKGIFKENALIRQKGYHSFMEKRREIKKKNNGGSHTFGEWELLKKQYGYICPSCKKSEPEIKLTHDHIIPLDKGGSDDIENIQPLCMSCNGKKHTKIIKYNI